MREVAEGRAPASGLTNEVIMLLLKLADEQPEAYLGAAIDPLGLFLIVGAGFMITLIFYAIFTPDRDGKESDREDPPPHGN